MNAQEVELVLQLARRLAAEDGVAPDPVWLASFEADVAVVLAERRASQDGAG